MTLKIARTVLALTVRLIDRIGVDVRTGGASAFVVCIDIVDIYDETRVGHIRSER